MTLTFDLLRPDDLLSLRVEAVNLHLDVSDPALPRLVRTDATHPALLVFRFPPQSVLEQAFFETATVSPPPFNPPASVPPSPPLSSSDDVLLLPGLCGSRLSGESRLVLRVPDGVDAVAYTTAGLLEWSHLQLVLPPAATVPAGTVHAPGGAPPEIAEPGPDVSAIELPYRLLLCPNVSLDATPAWVHALTPVVNAGRAELWHTRLAARRKVGQTTTEASRATPLPVRVVWSPDFVGDGPLPDHSTDDEPFLAPLSGRDRDQIVILGAGFSGYFLTTTDGAEQPYVPQPLTTERLFLSSLGGWLTSRGAWNFPVSYRYSPLVLRDRLGARPGGTDTPVPIELETATLDLIEWDHVATLGRDHYVRVVYEGFLYPFGHRASLVKVTERKVLGPNGSDGNPANSPVAFLRQRMYIVVREYELSYHGAPFQYDGRETPFQELVRVNVEVTPEIDPPGWIGSSSFWVSVGGHAYPFAMVGRDAAGNNVPFQAPLIFVSQAETTLSQVRDAYVSNNDLRRCAVKGRRVAYADPSAGDTVLKTTSLYFSSEITDAAGPYASAPFVPSLDAATVTVPSLSALLGQNTSVLIAPYQDYLDGGLDGHAGVFAEVVSTPPAVSFSADKSGGFARPNIALTALSARKGLVSGPPGEAAAGRIDPAAYFGSMDAQLFGTIDLGQLIPLDPDHLASADANAPTITTATLPNRNHPSKVVTHITWEPEVTTYTSPQVSMLFNQPGQPSAMTIHVRLEQHLDGTPPVSSAHGALSNFTLELFGVVALDVASITFTSSNGAKSIVKLDLASNNAITFEGPLAFIQTLASILPPGLFGGSLPSIRATATALRVAYTIGLPPVPCGVFSLQNIAIMAALDLPYLDGKPAVEFGFASRNRPFLVTVEIFGGGGFVHVVLDTSGIRMVEGAIEFGANFCLDLGVATGGVHAMAGIYFQLKGTSSDLTGFIDIGGEVSVLGIVSISLDLNISLSWQSSPSGNLIEGRATLTISVSVLFFSMSVSMSVERSFSAGSGDPDVAELVTAGQWASYAGAFA